MLSEIERSQLIKYNYFSVNRLRPCFVYNLNVKDKIPGFIDLKWMWQMPGAGLFMFKTNYHIQKSAWIKTFTGIMNQRK